MCFGDPRFRILVLATLLGARPAAPAAWAAEDVSGTWNLRVETADGTANPIIVLRQEGSKLSGTYRGRMGEVPLQGSLNGDSIRFEVRLRYRNESMTVSYTGTVRGDEMSGSVRFGDAGDGKWTARRSGDGA